jgi:hypothetical protein
MCRRHIYTAGQVVVVGAAVVRARAGAVTAPQRLVTLLQAIHSDEAAC